MRQEEWPSLETLELTFLYVSRLSAGRFHSVTTLRLVDCCYKGRFNVLRSFPNLVRLSLIDVVCGEVRLSAPKLEFFSYRDSCQYTQGIHDFSRIRLPSLKRAELYLSRKYLPNDVFLKLLHGIRNVEFLELSTIQLRAMNRAGLLKNQTSYFHKLKSLKLLVNYGLRSLSVPAAVKSYLLSGTPNSQNVHISLGFLPSDMEED
ncbi:hypothetical protein Tsubulata_048043 [Turnera subulata]|uniref:Uncharacterized protein n=1 Tax=Turnera subulata TaxID=218843 RepID=A0A9Q0FPM5_9ROSI|nr:hypothetical protein Tsubulata_048043 [Turnera subulata]